MPGYGGSTLAGYVLCILAHTSTTKLGILMVVLGIPLIDTGYVVVSSVSFGKIPVWGDRGHLHHRLLAIGWGKRRMAVFLLGHYRFFGLYCPEFEYNLQSYIQWVGITIVLGAYPMVNLSAKT